MESNSSNFREIPQIEEHRSFLELLTESLIERKLRRKIDAQDLVQETIWSAYQKFEWVREPDNPVVVRKWLAEILRHELADQRKKFYSGKRNVLREQSDVDDIDRSMAGIEAFAIASITSPSAALDRKEQMTRLAEALRHLTEDQREVVVQKYIIGRSVPEIAAKSDRTTKAVASLIFRGVEKLRVHLR